MIHKTKNCKRWCKKNVSGGLKCGIIRKYSKGIQIGKKGVKLPLFADDKRMYIEYAKDVMKNLLELINSVKLQDVKSLYRNLFCFYTLTMNY